MDSNIIVAIISLIGSLVGTFAGIVASSKLTIYRIEQLEKKVDKFVAIETRIYDLEAHNKIQDTRLDNIDEENERIIADIRMIKGSVFRGN